MQFWYSQRAYHTPGHDLLWKLAFWSWLHTVNALGLSNRILPIRWMIQLKRTLIGKKDVFPVVLFSVSAVPTELQSLWNIQRWNFRNNSPAVGPGTQFLGQISPNSVLTTWMTLGGQPSCQFPGCLPFLSQWLCQDDFCNSCQLLWPSWPLSVCHGCFILALLPPSINRLSTYRQPLGNCFLRLACQKHANGLVSGL